MRGSFLVHGLKVNLYCKELLFQGFESYFNSLCRGNRRADTQLDLELEMCDTPSPLPSDAVKEIQGPNVTYYSRGKILYFLSKDGSLISLDPDRRVAKGFLTHELLEKKLDCVMFISEPVAETHKSMGLYCLHAAALHDEDLSIVVSGLSGCGKTTTSVSLVANGFKYISDDTLLIEKLNGGVKVYPLYKSFNISQDIARRFPHLFKNGDKLFSEKGKVPVDISEIIPGSHIQSAIPDVIVFPKIVDASSSMIQPVGQLEVYQRLLSQTILAIDKNTAENQLRALEALVKQLRGFELLSGKDLYEKPDSIIGIIDRIRTPNETYCKNRK